MRHLQVETRIGVCLLLTVLSSRTAQGQHEDHDRRSAHQKMDPDFALAYWMEGLTNTKLIWGLARAQTIAVRSMLEQPESNQSFGRAVTPLPPTLRSGATIVRLDSEFRPHVMRQGSNNMVCIDDRPNDDEFDVRCYKDSFIPVVYRAFQLGYGVAGPKVRDEILAGKLKLSKEPTAGYRCLGPAAGYDERNNKIDERIECWQSVHFPFKTAAEIGFPEEKDVPDREQYTTPYVMGSGSYWSHVMLRHPPAR